MGMTIEELAKDFKSYVSELQMPRDDYNGIMEYIDDAIALLKEQEPRVMTLKELTGMYVEFNGDICPIRLTNFDLQKIIMYAADGVCRLWTGKPTYKQMKAVKWE